MDKILNNPYRILGVLAGTSVKDFEKQVRKLKKFVEAGIELKDDYSFPILGNVSRNFETINNCINQLNLDYEKFTAALFWFWNGNAIIDEPAFQELRDGEVEKAKEIWYKLTTNNKISRKNYSAYHNLSVLILSNCINGNKINENALKNGLGLRLKILESDLLEYFKSTITDITFEITKKEAQLLFLNEIKNEVLKNNKLSIETFIEFIKEYDFIAKHDFINSLINEIIDNIKNEINISKLKRKSTKENAFEAGNNLIKMTKDSINHLKNILGENDIKYISNADLLANEILQCGIDFFIHYRETDYDPSEKVMYLFQTAKSICKGKLTTQRVNENIQNLTKWINDKPERIKEQKVKIHLDQIVKLIEEYRIKEYRIDTAIKLLNDAKPILMKIKHILGKDDDYYLKISTIVVATAQDMLVKELNDVQYYLENQIDLFLDYTKIRFINLLKDTFTRGWECVQLLKTFDMTYEFKVKSFDRNVSAIKQTCEMLGITTSYYKKSSVEKEKIEQQTQQEKQVFNYSTNKIKKKNSKIKTWLILISGFIGLIISDDFGGVIWGAILGWILAKMFVDDI